MLSSPGRRVGLICSLCHPEGIREEQRRDCQTAGAHRDFVGFVFPQHCLQSEGMNKRVREDLLFPRLAVALYLHSGSGQGGAGAGGGDAGTQGERLLAVFLQGPWVELQARLRGAI